MDNKDSVMPNPERFREFSPEWEATVEAMEDGICIQSLDSRILRANRSFAEMIGLPMEQIIGRACSEVLCCSLQFDSSSFCAREACMKSGRCETEEISGRRSGQRLRARLSPVLSASGEITAFVMVVRDITDVVEREREFARIKNLSLIGELAAGLAHEIKNPLAGIQGAIDILIQREPEDPNRLVLERIRREVGRIDATVRALLDCARPRPVNIGPASLNEVVFRAVQLARDQIVSKKSDLRVSIKFEPNIQPLTVLIDSEQIEDAVLNLILNAVDSIKDEGSITIRTVQQNRPHTYAAIEVEDTGNGISQQDLSRIFSPFFTTKRGGTGLGLAAVKRIARAHGGRIEVSSEKGKGSTFTLQIPF